jgi:hypothetical protein
MNQGTCKIVIVLPAYNAAKTLMRTLAEIPPQYARHVILVDDASQDKHGRDRQGGRAGSVSA